MKMWSFGVKILHLIDLTFILAFTTDKKNISKKSYKGFALFFYTNNFNLYNLLSHFLFFKRTKTVRVTMLINVICQLMLIATTFLFNVQ